MSNWFKKYSQQYIDEEEEGVQEPPMVEYIAQPFVSVWVPDSGDDYTNKNKVFDTLVEALNNEGFAEYVFYTSQINRA